MLRCNLFYVIHEKWFIFAVKLKTHNYENYCHIFHFIGVWLALCSD